MESENTKKFKIAMLGLDGAGGTTILYTLKDSEMASATTFIQTIGFNVEYINHSDINLAIWDIGGSEKIRPHWLNFSKDAVGLIFVVDASDTNRLEEAKNELEKVIKGQVWPILIYANKKDRTNGIDVKEIIEKMDLKALLKNKNWHIQPTCALTKDGLDDGLDWLTLSLKIAFHLPLSDTCNVGKRDTHNETNGGPEAKRAKCES